MSRSRDVIAPPRLGRGFRLLMASSWTSNVGDGIALAAGPLLVASKTDQEFLVALAALLQWAPPLVFGLWAGALTDRLDRRLIIITVDLLRAVVLALLAAAVAFDTAPITLVLVAMFLLGTAEVFADNTAQTLLPMLVARDDLAIANARLQTGFVTINQLAAPPIGALLFTVGQFIPFATQAVVGPGRRPDLPPAAPRARPRARRGPAGLARHRRGLPLDLAPRRGPHAGADDPDLQRHVRRGLVGARALRHRAPRPGQCRVRAGHHRRCGRRPRRHPVLRLADRRISLGNIMRVGLIIETLTHLALAATSSPYVAMPVFFVFGAHAFVWGTTSITVRQRACRPSSRAGSGR